LLKDAILLSTTARSSEEAEETEEMAKACGQVEECGVKSLLVHGY